LPTSFFVYVNPKWWLISGLCADQALGEGWLEAVHQDRTIAWVMGQAVPEMNSDS
jgi:hypothetical protein